MRFSGSARLRPVRIGFLISPDELPTVRRVMRLNSCLWGGRYNPIIPFIEDTPARWTEHYSQFRGLDITRGYINFFEPDVIVEAVPGMADKLGWKHDNSRFELPRVVSLSEFFTVNNRKRVDFVAGLDVFNVIAHLYENEYKYQRRHKRSFALFDSTDDAVFELFGGAYPNDEPLKYISDAYRDVFEPETLSLSSTSYLKLVTNGYTGPLWVTRQGLEESFGRRNDPTIFVFDPMDPQDVIDCWNYRLIERNILPVNLEWLGDHAEFLRQKIQDHHRPIPGNPYGTMFHTSVKFGRSVSEKSVMDLVKRHFSELPEHSFFIGHYPDIWDVRKKEHHRPERKLLITSKSESFDEVVNSDGYVKIPAPSPEFHDKGKLYTRSTWINVIQPSVLYRDQDTAVVFPNNLWEPGFPFPRASPPITITREGWTTPQQYATHYSLLQPISGRDAIIGWFETRGIKAKPSEAGQIAAQIISAAGSLLACGMFADKETIELLNSMAESHSERARDGRQISRTEPDRAKHRNAIRDHFAKREKHSFGFWNKLDYFLERSVFRAGVRVQCPTCAYYNWFDLDTINYDPTCGRCLKQFKFSQTPKDLGKVEWFYRIIGPFAAPDYVRGGYAVALTLRSIAERHDSELTWSTGLELSNPRCEIDFAAWYRRSSIMSDEEREEPVLVIGEAKSFGFNAIDARSINNLRSVGEKFPGAFLIVSSLKAIADYSASELNLLRDLARWGRSTWLDGHPQNPVIVLTGVELFSERGIEQAWKKIGGRAADFVKPAYVDLIPTALKIDLCPLACGD